MIEGLEEGAPMNKVFCDGVEMEDGEIVRIARRGSGLRPRQSLSPTRPLACTSVLTWLSLYGVPVLCTVIPVARQERHPFSE